MKVVRVVGQLFVILSFLTLGCLCVIISLHWWDLDKAIRTLQAVYASNWKSVQVGLIGLLFISVGLAFLKMLVKMGPHNEAIIYQSEAGPVIVSGKAIEDVAKKVLKKSPFVKEYKHKLNIEGRKVEVYLRLVLWGAAVIPDALNEIQEETTNKILKLVGDECQVEVTCDLMRVDEPEDTKTRSAEE